MVSTQFFIIGKIIVRPNLIFKRKLLNNHHLVQSFEKLEIFINVTSYNKQKLHNIIYNLLILNAYIILVSYTFYSLFWGSFVRNGNRKDIYSVDVLCQNTSNLWDLLGPYLPLAWFFYCAEVRMLFGSGEGVNRWPSKVASTSLHYANATIATPNWRFYSLGKHFYID